jgi:hypothetical protein
VQDLSVCGDDQGVVVGDLFGDFGYTGRLVQAQACGARELGNRGGLMLAAPALAGVGLGDHEPDVVGRGDQAAEDGGSEIGCAGEC